MAYLDPPEDKIVPVSSQPSQKKKSGLWIS